MKRIGREERRRRRKEGRRRERDRSEVREGEAEKEMRVVLGLGASSLLGCHRWMVEECITSSKSDRYKKRPKIAL